MKVDFVLSCGSACRPAFHTKRLCLRKFSSPCDWMMSYSLSQFVEVLRTEGNTMFRNAKYDENNKWVCDEDTGMISMHDFNSNVPLADQLQGFYDKMERRAKNTVAQISHSRSVGLIMNRDVDSEELVRFAESMSSLFPQCAFYIINVKDNPSLSSYKEERLIQTKNYTITQICFNDAHPDGRDPKTNESFWKGNTKAWTFVLLNYFQVKGQRYEYTSRLIKDFTKKTAKRVIGKIKAMLK